MRESRYGALVDVGEQVEQGQAIGLSGDTGCTNQPHVHVALRRNRNDFSRQTTLPLNFRNASGRVDPNRSLRQAETYPALPY
jgi:murein DD-endopeptidase MepM/ murein hydrolase activator NlpD